MRSAGGLSESGGDEIFRAEDITHREDTVGLAGIGLRVDHGVVAETLLEGLEKLDAGKRLCRRRPRTMWGGA